MRPNIAILGMYNLAEYRQRQPLIDVPVPTEVTDEDAADASNMSREQLPTDACRTEQSVTPTAWVNMLEDLLMSLQINVALAKGFKNLQLPKLGEAPPKGKKYIDLWPIRKLPCSLLRFTTY
jgi:solute carrier family 12 (potassium/chloride transporters), member 9